MNIILKAALAITTTFASTAVVSAGPPSPLPLTESRSSAAAFALTHAGAVEALRTACDRDPNAGPKFAEAAQQWLQRNADDLAAGRWWLDGYEAEVIARQEGQAAASKFRSDIPKYLPGAVTAFVKRSISGPTPTAADCTRLANALNSGVNDLIRDPKYAEDYRDIRYFKLLVAEWERRRAAGTLEGRSQCIIGWKYAEKGDTNEARRRFGACTRNGHLSNASLARTYRGVAYTYMQTKRPREAVAMYAKAIALRPYDVVDDYINRANAYDEAGEFDKAMTDYGRALKLDPGYGEAYFARGTAYERRGMADKAKADFLSAYRHGMRSPSLYQRLWVNSLMAEAQSKE